MDYKKYESLLAQSTFEVENRDGGRREDVSTTELVEVTVLACADFVRQNNLSGEELATALEKYFGLA